MSIPSMSKALQEKLKRKALKVSRNISSSRKTANEIAAGFSKAKDPFLQSEEWKSMRKRVIETYGAKCMKCSHIPKSLRQINVDHIKPRKYYPELALVFGNLQVLCCACNKKKGNTSEIDYRPK